MSNETPFEYEGMQLGTIGALMDAMTAIYENGDQGEANRFMAAYRAHTPHAVANVGYLTGYCDPETMRGMQQMFCVGHPVFGTHEPTAEEAFEMGKAMARG